VTGSDVLRVEQHLLAGTAPEERKAGVARVLQNGPDSSALPSIGEPMPEVVELRLYTSQRSFNAITRREDLPKDKIKAIYNVSRQITENPLSAYRDLDREAFVALRRSGNTRVSFVMAAASAEVILDRTLMLASMGRGKDTGKRRQGLEGIT